MVKIHFDTREFDAAIRSYMRHSQRDFAEVLNQKGYSVTLTASKVTFKTTANRIRHDIEQNELAIAKGINKSRKLAGLKGLRGAEMAEAIKQEEKARIRSIAFLRSGWLVAVGSLAKAIGKPFRRAKGVAHFGDKLQGGAIAAIPGDRPQVEFWHATISKFTRNVFNVRHYVEAGLDFALKQEMRRMAQYIERKLQARYFALNRPAAAALLR